MFWVLKRTVPMRWFFVFPQYMFWLSLKKRKINFFWYEPITKVYTTAIKNVWHMQKTNNVRYIK